MRPARNSEGTAGDVTIAITCDRDIIEAREACRTMGDGLADDGMAPDRFALICLMTATSEIARNILQHARYGTVTIEPVQDGAKKGIRVVAKDAGPGIANVAKSLEDGYSTSGGLRFGLPGSTRLMDDFEIDTHVGVGTTVTMIKWLPIRPVSPRDTVAFHGLNGRRHAGAVSSTGAVSSRESSSRMVA